MSFLRLLGGACLAGTLLLSSSREARAAGRPIALVVVPDGGLDPAELRDAVERELDAEVTDPGDDAAFTVIVRVDPARRELVVERTGPSAVSRRVPLPADHEALTRTAVFLVGNVARDEAAELLGVLRPAPAPPPTEPPPPPPPAHAWWFGAWAEGDLVALPSASDVCATPSNGWTCQSPGGGPFPPAGVSLRPGESDRVQSGLSPANARFLASAERAVGDHLLLGGRIGFATATYSGSALRAFGPLHLEARATAVLGRHPFAGAGVFPQVTLGAGLAEHSAGVDVTGIFGGTSAPLTTATARAWRVAGPGFVSLGVGLRVVAFDPVAFVVVPLKATFAFGDASLVGLTPEVGVQVGF